LKNPQGLLIEGSYEENMQKLKTLIDDENPSLIIAVGDIVSQKMIDFGLPLDVLIIDNKTMRKPIQPITVDADHTVYAKNPAGTITYDAWSTIKRAIESGGRTKVVIDGEEDLLTIVTVLSAPESAVVVYGQPNAGIVVVKVTGKKKEEMQHIIDLMKKSSKN
jgi:uncharacterized protein (UPF0218 family)